MQPFCDLTGRIFADIAPFVLSGSGVRWDDGEETLRRIGSTLHQEQIATLVGGIDRHIPVMPGLAVKIKALRTILAELPDEGVGPADWPYDHLDVEGKRYRLSYLFSRHHALLLTCRYLAGVRVPQDVLFGFRKSGLNSTIRTVHWAAEWEASLPGVLNLGLDA